MSDSNGPVRRRRIAGEASAATAAAAKKAVPKKRSAKKAADTSTPVAKKTLVARMTPAASRPLIAPTPPAVSAATPRRSQSDRTAGSGPTRRDLWLVPATLLAVASLVVGVYLIINPPGSSGANLETSQRQASSAAAGAAETIFSFRYDELDQHLTASKALMTPSFAKDFDKIAPALTELAPQRQIVVEAAARDAAAVPCGDECSPDKVDVLVFVDQARLVSGTTTPTVFANRIKVSMVKGDDGWRVDDIRAL